MTFTGFGARAKVVTTYSEIEFDLGIVQIYTYMTFTGVGARAKCGHNLLRNRI